MTHETIEMHRGIALGAGEAYDRLVYEALSIFNGLPESRQREIMEEQRKGVELAQTRDAERRRREANPCLDVNLGPAPASYFEALLRCAERYRDMLMSVEGRADPELVAFVAEFAVKVGEGYPVPKLCRWLGYIQRGVIEKGLTTVEAERTWTRPLFRPFDFPVSHQAPQPDFQGRCQKWLDEITHDDATDLVERRARFLEEAMELVQSLDMSLIEVIQIAAYVFGRPVGNPTQEYGGMLTTAMVLAHYTGHDLMGCGERELRRVQAPEVVAKIRGKRSRRHGRGPLPGTSEPEADLVPK